MAVFTTGTSFAINMNTFNPTETLYGTVSYRTSSRYGVDDSSTNYDDFYGQSFGYLGGRLTSGTINRVESFHDDVRYFNVSGLAMDAAKFLQFGDNKDYAGARAYMLSGSDTIYGAGGSDILNGYGGNDTIYGYGGADTLYGGSGNDLLSGGLGIDTMYGGTGNDIFYISRAEDKIVEYVNQGADKLISSASYTLATNVSVQTLTAHANAGAINLTGNNFDNLVNGNGAANILRGGSGHDDLEGFDGADDLFGGTGDDVLIGGAGIDLLVGDEGDDIFAFDRLSDSAAPGKGSDIIDDFFKTADETDTIDVSGIDAKSATAFNDQFTFIGQSGFHAVAGELRFGYVGGNTIVSADVDGNGVADFGIELTGLIALDRYDFML